MHVPIQQKCLKTFKSQNNGFISFLNVWISKCIQMDIITINWMLVWYKIVWLIWPLNSSKWRTSHTLMTPQWDLAVRSNIPSSITDWMASAEVNVQVSWVSNYVKYQH